MTAQPPVPPETLTAEFDAVGGAADRLRMVALDQAVRLQAGRTGAAARRLLLVRARRPEAAAEIAALETALARERGTATAFDSAVTTAEIDRVRPTENAAVVHGLLIGDAKVIAALPTVAAVRADGSVRRFTCADAKGYFRLDLPPEDAETQSVFLQVSDADQAVLYRGDEAIDASPGTVSYRRITLSGDRLAPCPIPPDRATMPRLLEMPESQALAVLGRLGLSLGQRLTKPAQGREGLVISQQPAAGTPVDASTSVTLVIGTAADGTLVQVPPVVGRSRDEAQATLTEAGLAIGQVSELPSPRTPDTVLAQVPAAGTSVSPGTAVDLTVAVAAPDDRIEVPDLVDLPQQDAAAKLQESGLAVGRVTFRDDERVGVVIAHAPPAGARLPRGTAVNLTVGRRSDPETATVPSLAGRTAEAAREILSAVGLALGDLSGDRRGVVAAQRPDAGTTVPVGSAVSISLRRADDRPDRPAFAGRVSERAAADPGFVALGIDAARLRDTLREAGVESPDALDRVIALDNQRLGEMFGLDNLAHARSLRRILREARDAER